MEHKIHKEKLFEKKNVFFLQKYGNVKANRPCKQKIHSIYIFFVGIDSKLKIEFMKISPLTKIYSFTKKHGNVCQHRIFVLYVYFRWDWAFPKPLKSSNPKWNSSVSKIELRLFGLSKLHPEIAYKLWLLHIFRISVFIHHHLLYSVGVARAKK